MTHFTDLDARDAEIVALRRSGETLAAIGSCFDLSRERVRQILIEVANGWVRGHATRKPRGEDA